MSRWKRERTPYAEIDPPVRNLIRVLNRFPGCTTYTSCGGHADVEIGKDDGGCRSPEGFWYVDSHIDRTDAGWLTLEFFAWLDCDGLAPSGVFFDVMAKAPYCNYPGEMIFFRWSGNDPDEPRATADNFAEELRFHRSEAYMTPARAQRWLDEVRST